LKEAFAMRQALEATSGVRQVKETGLQCPNNKTCEEQCSQYVNALPDGSRRLVEEYMNLPGYSKYPG
jgi:hypothetical protein